VKRLVEIETGVTRRSRWLAAFAERRSLWLTSTAVFALALVVLVSLEPIVRSLVQRKAERMGLVVSVEALSLGLDCVWLEGVKVEIPKMPALKLDARAIRAAIRGFGAGDIVVQGGTIQLDGTMTELRRQLREWQADRAPAGEHTESSGRKLEYSGIDLVWRDALDPKSEIVIWGAAGQRDGTHEAYRFDLARLGSSEAFVELGRFATDVVRTQDRRALQNLSAETLTLQASLDALPVLARRLLGGDTDETLGAPKPSANPSHNAVESSTAQGFVLNRLRKGVELLRPKLQSHLSPDAKIALDRVTLRLTQSEQALSLGPASLHAALEGDRFIAKVAPGTDASEETLALGLELPLSAGDTVLSLEGGPISLARLGAHEGDMWLRNVEHTTLSARTRVVLPASAGRVSIEANGELHDWAILQPRLAPDPVSGQRLGFKVSASAAEDGSTFDLKS
jgi:hypothetical protein